MAKEKDDTILARWLSGELTPEEKEALESSGDLKLLEKIVTKTNTWSLPDLKNDYYASLQEKIAEKKNPKVIPLYRNKWVMSIAASVLLIVGIFSLYRIFFVENIVSYQCEAGQKLDVYLPDKTLVKLNGYSRISYVESDDWKSSRKVMLEGEAYFDVRQKGPFSVSIPQGEVNVLGTKFNILSGTTLAIVKCFEGKVSVTDQKQQEEILTQGKGLKLYADSTAPFDTDEKTPDWINGESIFKDAPLLEVINAISVQFNVQFDISNEKNLERKFTGKFIHTDLETALTMVFPAMNIQYSVEGEKRKMVILK